MTALMKSEDGLMWRGALGGALGAPIFLIGMALYEKLRIGYVVYAGALEIGALPIFLVIGAALGATVGSYEVFDGLVETQLCFMRG
jgi:hypothetical protein